MDAFVTRCPLCMTCFRVTVAQLSVASGAVRCGACTHIFQADRNRLDTAAQDNPDRQLSQDYIDSILGGSANSKPVAQDAEAVPSVTDRLETEFEPVDESQPGDDAQSEPTDTFEMPAVHHGALVPVRSVFAPLPIEMERWRSARIAWRRAALITLVVLGVVALLLQYAWLRRVPLALDPTWRPWYEFACERLHCSLPRYRDPSLIRSESLVIRPAAKRRNVLLVDAIIGNHADFAQDLPGLELVFTEIDGSIVAQRTFMPEEYLLPAERTRKEIAARESIRIHLELMNPGESAVNYRLYLRDLGQ